jgi:hypothetical protein
MVPFMWTGLFHPVVTPKILGALFVLLTFAVLRRCLQRLCDAGEVVVGLILMLLALNSSFVVWAISGLENPLYVCLATTLLWRALVIATTPVPGAWEAAACALLATGTMLTRPDGVLYAIAVPVVVFGCWVADRRQRTLPTAARFVGTYLGMLILLVGSFLLFRYYYFHDLVPNTYHAKNASLAGTLRELGFRGMMLKCGELLDSVLGVKYRTALLAVLAILGLCSARTRRLRREHLVWLLFLILSAAIFLLLPGDWMPMFRFATPFLVFFYGFWVWVAADSLQAVAWRSLRITIGGIAAVAALTGTLYHYVPQTAEFRDQPTVPFETIAAVYGDRFNDYAARLGIRDGSILLPDLGGTLTRSNLRVWDLAGLCDRTLGRALGKDQAAVHDYVFEVVKPTFIHVHDHWACMADLEADPRFRRDYLGLFEIEDPWIAARFHRRRHSGDYVRRDAVNRNEKELEQIRSACRDFWHDFLHAPRFRRLFPLQETIQAMPVGQAAPS